MFVVAFLGRTVLGWFVDLVSLGAIIAYTYTSLSAIKFAREEHNAVVCASSMLVIIAFAIMIFLQFVLLSEASSALS